MDSEASNTDAVANMDEDVVLAVIDDCDNESDGPIQRPRADHQNGVSLASQFCRRAEGLLKRDTILSPYRVPLGGDQAMGPLHRQRQGWGDPCPASRCFRLLVAADMRDAEPEGYGRGEDVPVDVPTTPSPRVVQRDTILAPYRVPLRVGKAMDPPQPVCGVWEPRATPAVRPWQPSCSGGSASLPTNGAAGHDSITVSCPAAPAARGPSHSPDDNGGVKAEASLYATHVWCCGTRFSCPAAREHLAWPRSVGSVKAEASDDASHIRRGGTRFYHRIRVPPRRPRGSQATARTTPAEQRPRPFTLLAYGAADRINRSAASGCRRRRGCRTRDKPRGGRFSAGESSAAPALRWREGTFGSPRTGGGGVPGSNLQPRRTPPPWLRSRVLAAAPVLIVDLARRAPRDRGGRSNAEWSSGTTWLVVCEEQDQTKDSIGPFEPDRWNIIRKCLGNGGLEP
ncbi:hypothetical protein F4804DRAFT_332134 [Jackrogersella minutella]|nr:hypothetical protein F4804DRAFT_332134 [Jackrogersella minutella]